MTSEERHNELLERENDWFNATFESRDKTTRDLYTTINVLIDVAANIQRAYKQSEFDKIKLKFKDRRLKEAVKNERTGNA